jgi:serine/threonine protein kinase
MARSSDPKKSAAARQSASKAEDPTQTASTIHHVGTPGAAELAALGAQLPDFELLCELGRGGMGVVYKARQKSLDRLVAIKMLFHGQDQSDLALARFRAEARAAAMLRHPNIVGIHQVGQCPLGHFFSMEYIEGQTLQDVLTKHGSDKPVHIAGAVNLMIQVAEALAYAHSKGVIHRDLKPGNIMVDATKRPIVMDFGIAKVADKGENLTAKGVVMGTPAYMPPEQTGEGTGKVGPHSDVYSLGAVLYRMLTGRPPYEAETALRIILQVISAEMPPAVHELRPAVPPELSDLCMKCLSKKPEDRYADATALLKELRALKASGKLARSGQLAVVPALVLVSAKTGKPINLVGTTFTLGRGTECEVVIKSAEVSKRHCRIVVRDGKVSLEDLDSVNGTQVNGKAVTRVDLSDGDVLEIGDHQFTVRLNRA